MGKKYRVYRNELVLIDENGNRLSLDELDRATFGGMVLRDEKGEKVAVVEGILATDEAKEGFRRSLEEYVELVDEDVKPTKREGASPTGI